MLKYILYFFAFMFGLNLLITSCSVLTASSIDSRGSNGPSFAQSDAADAYSGQKSDIAKAYTDKQIKRSTAAKTSVDGLMRSCQNKRKSMSFSETTTTSLKTAPCECMVAQIKTHVAESDQYEFMRSMVGIIHAEADGGQLDPGMIKTMHEVSFRKSDLSLEDYKTKMALVRGNCGVVF